MDEYAHMEDLEWKMARDRREPKVKSVYTIAMISVILIIIGFAVVELSGGGLAEIPNDAVTDRDALLGEWNRDTTGGLWYTFYSDGTGTMLRNPATSEFVNMTWTTQDDVLTILRFDGVESNWTFGVLDDILFLRGVELHQSRRFVREN